LGKGRGGEGGFTLISREKGKAIPKNGKGKASQGEKGKGTTGRIRFEAHSHLAMDTRCTHKRNETISRAGKGLGSPLPTPLAPTFD